MIFARSSIIFAVMQLNTLRLDTAPGPCIARLGAVAPLIGNTPLLTIRLTLDGRPMTIRAKAEMFSLTGSIKDRMAHAILAQAYQAGELVPGQPIAEATSGNAGIAIAALGRMLGHPVTIFMPDWMSMERRSLLASHGAHIRLVSKAEGGFLGAIALAEEMGAREGAFLPRQFSNDANWRAHFETTAPELVRQMGRVAGFVAGVGTGGTVMGVGRYLKAIDASVAVHPVEPAESPTLTTGHKVGHHRIQGVSDEFIPEIVRLDALDPVIAVPDGDAILMAQAVARELGLGVGISSGANLLAAVMTAERLGGNAAVATVFADGSAKYLSTDLALPEPVRDGYLTPRITLQGMDISR